MTNILETMDAEMLMDEREQFEKLGIIEGQVFQLKELTGFWRIDIENRVAWCYRNEYEVVRGKRERVRGVYEHILDGTWHVLSVV